MLKFFRWSLRHSASSLLVSEAPTGLPFLFSSPHLWLLFCPRHFVFSFIFSFTSNSLADLAGAVFSLLLFYQATNGSPDTRFFPGNDEADELARPGALLLPSAIPCILSPLISRIYFSLFPDWSRTVSTKFFDTQVPSITTKELMLPHQAHRVLSRLRCNGHSLLLSSYFYRIGRIENPSCQRTPVPEHLPFHSAQSSYGLFAPFRSLATLYLSTTSIPGPEELLGFWGSMLFCHAPIPRKVSGNNNNSNLFREWTMLNPSVRLLILHTYGENLLRIAKFSIARHILLGKSSAKFNF